MSVLSLWLPANIPLSDIRYARCTTTGRGQLQWFGSANTYDLVDGIVPTTPDSGLIDATALFQEWFAWRATPTTPWHVLATNTPAVQSIVPRVEEAEPYPIFYDSAMALYSIGVRPHEHAPYRLTLADLLALPGFAQTLTRPGSWIARFNRYDEAWWSVETTDGAPVAAVPVSAARQPDRLLRLWYDPIVQRYFGATDDERWFSIADYTKTLPIASIIAAYPSTAAFFARTDAWTAHRGDYDDRWTLSAQTDGTSPLITLREQVARGCTPMLFISTLVLGSNYTGIANGNEPTVPALPWPFDPPEWTMGLELLTGREPSLLPLLAQPLHWQATRQTPQDPWNVTAGPPESVLPSQRSQRGCALLIVGALLLGALIIEASLQGIILAAIGGLTGAMQMRHMRHTPVPSPRWRSVLFSGSSIFVVGLCAATGLYRTEAQFMCLLTGWLTGMILAIFAFDAA